MRPTRLRTVPFLCAVLLPACAGRLMEAELKALDAALGNPARPVVAVVGGAKVSTKLDLLGNLLRRVDTLVIGGGMASAVMRFHFDEESEEHADLGQRSPRRPAKVGDHADDVGARAEPHEEEIRRHSPTPMALCLEIHVVYLAGK